MHYAITIKTDVFMVGLHVIYFLKAKLNFPNIKLDPYNQGAWLIILSITQHINQ